MPMVRHDAVRKKCDVAAVHGFLEEADEGRVIERIFKKHGAFGCSVEYVKDQSRGSFPSSSRHGAIRKATSMPLARIASVLGK